jgi:hypothetical protein
MNTQQKLKLLKKQCDKLERDFNLIVTLISKVGFRERTLNPGWWLILCEDHQIQVNARTFSHGDVTAWNRKTAYLPVTDWSYAAAVAFKHPDLITHLRIPHNIERARRANDDIPFLPERVYQVPKYY